MNQSINKMDSNYHQEEEQLMKRLVTDLEDVVEFKGRIMIEEIQRNNIQQQQQTETETEEDKWRDLLPTGYRFKPTDEELLGYLYSKLCKLSIRQGIIADVNVYDYHPSSLSAMAFDAGDEVLYFFTALERKCENGMRPKRGTKTGGGYWRTTSKPIDITTFYNSHPNNSEAITYKIMGIKRSLVYMIGKPSDKGIKTNWIMHEYTIHDVKPSSPQQANQWNKYIVCSIYHRQTRGGDSTESSLGKRKQQEQQIMEPDSETEAEEYIDNEVHKQILDVDDEDNPTKRTRV